MSPLQIIEKAKSLGVSLHLTNRRSIRFKGQSKSVDEVMPILQVHKAELIQWIEFCDLYAYLASKNYWTELDHQAWCKDLIDQPELTMNCLRALRHSWDSGNYGCHTKAAWLRGETKNLLDAFSSKSATNFSQMSN